MALESQSGQVKSRLLPLSSFADDLEWLIECLPRRNMRIELNPISDVDIISESKGEYYATGNAPCFGMKFSPSPTFGSWYYLEAALVRNNGSRDASIRAYISGGSEEAITITIPTNLRGTVREVFYLPQNVISLHWLPTEASGYFSHSPLLIHKISSLESIFRRTSRVVFDLWRFRNRTSATRSGLTWWGLISNLQDAYHRSAMLRIKRLMGVDYQAFIALNDTLSKSDIRAMRKQLSQLPHCPVISLIMPVQGANAEFFRDALEFVTGQIYPHWELLLVGDFAADTQCLAIAKEYSRNYEQIKIITFKPSGELSALFNCALDQTQGEFVARINQHDLIPSHALFFLACEINKHPKADLIYTDDDSINDTSKRHDPRFKPDWNPDLLLSHNYLENLVLYRKERVQELRGYRSGFEGAESYDLSLRYIKGIHETHIRHITRVLYHARTSRQSSELTTTFIPEDSSAHQSGKRALTAYFEGSGVIVEDGPAPALYRIKHPLPAQPPLVSIIIPTRDKVEILKKCIESIQQKTDYRNWEVWIVDNGSVEPETLSYFEKIQGDKRIKVIHYEKPFNYSALNNYAVQFAHGELLALLNNDVEVISHDWLTEMVSHAIRPGIGAVGAKLLYSNGTVQHAGVIVGLGGVAGHGHKFIKDDAHGYCHRAVLTQNLSAVTGACLVVMKSIYTEVGGLDEANLAVAFNDIDFCLKLREAGYKNIYTPYAKLFHHESISRGQDDTPDKQNISAQEAKYFKSFWGDELKYDPAYNSNLSLTLESDSFILALKQ